MDLRDFSRSRAGSAFELQQLARRIGAQRVVLAVDDSTDREFLTASFGGRTPRLLELPARDVADRDLERVFEAAIDAAYATDPPAQAALGASGS